MLFRTSVEDVKRWSQEDKFDKIINVLNNRDPAVRAAAAEALLRLDRDPHYTSQTTLNFVVGVLLERLWDDDARVVASAACALGHFSDARALEPLISVLGLTKDAVVRDAASEAIQHLLSLNIKGEQEKRCLAALRRLTTAPRPSTETVQRVLYAVSTVYIRWHWEEEMWWDRAKYLRHKEESPIGKALTGLGRIAGEQLIKAAEDLRKFPGLAESAAAAAVFGARILGGKHVVNG